MTDATKDPREAVLADWGDEWCSAVLGGDVPPAYEDVVLARLNAADPLRAILPEVVEAWKTFEEQYVHEFGEHRVKGDHLDRTFQRLSGALAPLRALTATEGGTDDGE